MNEQHEEAVASLGAETDLQRNEIRHEFYQHQEYWYICTGCHRQVKLRAKYPEQHNGSKCWCKDGVLKHAPFGLGKSYDELSQEMAEDYGKRLMDYAANLARIEAGLI